MGVAHAFEEAWFKDGDRVLRQGMTGSGLYLILDGQASIRVDGEERAKLSRGEFFGEVSILLGRAAGGRRRCPGHPALPRPCQLGGRGVPATTTRRLMYRMLQASARRLRNANRWRS